MGDIDIAIDCESTIDEHGESIHELLTCSIASGNKIAATIELIEIGGTVHGAETSISLMIELRKAEMILRRSLIRGEAGNGIRRISDDGVAEAGFETGEDSGADTGDARFARFIIVRNREWT